MSRGLSLKSFENSRTNTSVLHTSPRIVMLSASESSIDQSDGAGERERRRKGRKSRICTRRQMYRTGHERFFPLLSFSFFVFVPLVPVGSGELKTSISPTQIPPYMHTSIHKYIYIYISVERARERFGDTGSLFLEEFRCICVAASHRERHPSLHMVS